MEQRLGAGVSHAVTRARLPNIHFSKLRSAAPSSSFHGRSWYDTWAPFDVFRLASGSGRRVDRVWFRAEFRI